MFARPISKNDVEMDFEALSNSKEHIRGVFGPDDQWPQNDLSFEEDLIALENHENEHDKRVAFTYTVLNLKKNICLGCIYILPIHSKDYDAQVFLWVIHDAYEKGYDQELYDEVIDWMNSDWPFKNVAYPGRNMDWLKYEQIQIIY